MTPERFKEIRLAAGLTQAELAICIGVSTIGKSPYSNTVSRYECGKTKISPTIAILMLLYSFDGDMTLKDALSVAKRLERMT